MATTLRNIPNYHEVMDLMCGGRAEKCKIFDQEANIISPDGGHLTKEGAIEVGKRLFPLFSKIIDEQKRKLKKTEE